MGEGGNAMLPGTLKFARKRILSASLIAMKTANKVPGISFQKEISNVEKFL